MITSDKTIPVYKNGAGIHEVINELQRQARELAYDKNFYKKYGFASCFECDKTFTDLDELAEHQEEHLIKERTLG
ncbi:MAG: hypothetical protein CXT73_04725 [Methanobacteriota archaeon]|jgi:hypothetical protein|nr:MAG: hypothetical protein CXT73_04725 [Euryarchaeota archaeon]